MADVEKKDIEKKIKKSILDEDVNIIDLIVEMKDLAGLVVDLGFSALLLQDKKLAERIIKLEEDMNLKMYEIEALCMLAANNKQDAIGLIPVIKMAAAAESISNAIRELTDTIIQGIKPHPIIGEALKSAAETVDYINVGKKSKIIGKNIKEIRDHANVIGLKRNDNWMYQPNETTRIEPNDVLIFSGKKSHVQAVIKEIKK
ncbi:MAG: TrkA C-terminal domain-containing protein [Candidatus Aenigmatarchaeota archaeon]|nr:hypothetical protein [Nanoarchaeota archaeon]